MRLKITDLLIKLRSKCISVQVGFVAIDYQVQLESKLGQLDRRIDFSYINRWNLAKSITQNNRLNCNGDLLN